MTEFSGRGVGLDVVQDTIRKVGGSVRITTRPAHGTSFHLQLPVTLSVLRAVLVEISGEPYAFPHNRIDRLLRVPRSDIRSVETRQFVTIDGQLTLWDADAARKVREVTLPGPVLSFSFAADGRHLATANANGTVYILRLPKG